jgi:DUF2075 family protein
MEKEWNKYEVIDLTEVDTFTISSATSEYSIQVMEKNPCDVILGKEIFCREFTQMIVNCM